MSRTPWSTHATGGYGSARALCRGPGRARRADRALGLRHAAGPGRRVGGATLKDITWQIAANFDPRRPRSRWPHWRPNSTASPGRQDRLSDALARVAGDYDFCIVDCPPNVGLLTFNAMRLVGRDHPRGDRLLLAAWLAKQLELLEQLKKQCHQELRSASSPRFMTSAPSWPAKCSLNCASSLAAC